MKLTVIGCSGSYPGPDNPASSYLVEQDHEGRTWRLLLDLGSGALGALQKYADPLSVDAVALSHLHADHCLDLCGYYVLRKYHPAGQQPAIPVFGPVGTAERMARAYDLPESPGMSGEFDFREYDATPLDVGPFRITPFAVSHPVPAFALRVEAGGRVLTFSGDTGPCPGLIEAARDADLFLCEAAFREEDDNPPDLHLTGLEAGQAATAAAARRLVLTHVPPWFSVATALAEAARSFGSAVELAEPGASYDV